MSPTAKAVFETAADESGHPLDMIALHLSGVLGAAHELAKASGGDLLQVLDRAATCLQMQIADQKAQAAAAARPRPSFEFLIQGDD